MNSKKYIAEDGGNSIIITQVGLGPFYVFDKGTGEIRYAKSSSTVPPISINDMNKGAKEVLENFFRESARSFLRGRGSTDFVLEFMG